MSLSSLIQIRNGTKLLTRHIDLLLNEDTILDLSGIYAIAHSALVVRFNRNDRQLQWALLPQLPILHMP
jgi:hypothetical protein